MSRYLRLRAGRFSIVFWGGSSVPGFSAVPTTFEKPNLAARQEEENDSRHSCVSFIRNLSARVVFLSVSCPPRACFSQKGR